jgi:hypothetical protein
MGAAGDGEEGNSDIYPSVNFWKIIKTERKEGNIPNADNKNYSFFKTNKYDSTI